jgi:protein CWC15
MTTAHKPTFKPSVGGSNQGGNKLYIPTKQFSSRDLPGHLKIKVRREGQGSYKDIRKKDFKSELLARESKPNKNKNLVEYEGGENDNNLSNYI